MKVEFKLKRTAVLMVVIAIAWILLNIAPLQAAASMSLNRFVPRNSFLVIGADFNPLRANEIFVELEQKGHIWSTDNESDFQRRLESLRIDPRRDIQTLVLAKYVNSYGSKGKIYLVELTRSLKAQFENKTPTEYLGIPMYRMDSGDDAYCAEVAPDTIVLGNLNEVKMAVDVSRAKTPSLSQNVAIQSLLQKIPQTAAVWGASVPYSRKDAAALGIDQSTNAVLEAFENYYFYGIPKKTTGDAFFIGRATGEKQAAFVSTFMIGTLTFAKLRVHESVADALDQIQVDREGNLIKVNGIVTKELVAAYLEGDLGVE
jgi:hypothetical protein